VAQDDIPAVAGAVGVGFGVVEGVGLAVVGGGTGDGVIVMRSVGGGVGMG